jgi:hypothetical protein
VNYSAPQKLTEFILLLPEALVFEILSLKLEHPASDLPAGLGKLIDVLTFPTFQASDLKLMSRELQGSTQISDVLKAHLGLEFEPEYLQLVSDNWDGIAGHAAHFSTTILYVYVAYVAKGETAQEGLATLVSTLGFIVKWSGGQLQALGLSAMFYCIVDYLQGFGCADFDRILGWITHFFGAPVVHPPVCLTPFTAVFQRMGQTDLTANGLLLIDFIQALYGEHRLVFSEQYVVQLIDCMLYPLSELVVPVLELYVRLSQFVSDRSNLKFVAFFGNAFWKFLRNQPPFLIFPVLEGIARKELPPVTACKSVFRFWAQIKFARGLQMTSAIFFPTQQPFLELIRDETLQRLHLITQVAARSADFADLLLSSMCEILVKGDPGERFWDLFVVFLFICDQLPLFVTKGHIDVVLSPPLFLPT